MSEQRVLYREWRPLNFDQVVGQSHVVNALRQSARTGDIAHAYLFSGTRGTGKTSLAKIFARAINCKNLDENANPCNECEICTTAISGNLLDIIEMDAASNNSVDDIRRITDEVLFLPTLTQYKVYIIDEVHMLSTAAFNALLKTLEEPPAHAVFILATTDPQRIPATILSRTQRYDFKRISSANMLERLRLIADSNDISIDDDALKTIVSYSEGALRDAISLLDQSRSVYSRHISREDILDMTGIVSDEFMLRMVEALVSGDVDILINTIDELIMEGGDITRFASSLAQYLRNLLVYINSKNPEILLQIPSETLNSLKQLAPLFTSQELIEHIGYISKLQMELKQSQSPRITLEVGLINLMQNMRKDGFKMSNNDYYSYESNSSVATMEMPVGMQFERAETPEPKPAPDRERPDGPAVPETPSTPDTPAEPMTEPNVPSRPDPDEIEPLEPIETPVEPGDDPDIVKPEAPGIGEPEQPIVEPEDPDTPETPEELPTKPETPGTSPARPSPEEKPDFDPSPRVEPGKTTMPTPATEIPTQRPTTEVTSPSTTEMPSRNVPEITSADTSGFMDLTSILDGSASVVDSGAGTEASAETLAPGQATSNVVINVDDIWNKLVGGLQTTDPLAALVLNTANKYVDGSDFVIEFAPANRNFYDKIRSNNHKASLESNFQEASKGTGLNLKLGIEGELDRPADAQVKVEPEWVTRMRKAAEQLNIPVEENID